MIDDPIKASLTAVAREQPYPAVFVTVSGAHLYGFPSADSDYDLRGAYVLPVAEVVGLNTGPETIETEKRVDDLEIEVVMHDVYKFFKLLLSRNGYVLEQLYSPLIVHTTPAHAELKRIAAQCITRHHAHHYLGFARNQWDLFNKERTVKALLYTYRVLLTGIHLMRTGRVEASLLRLNEDFGLGYVDELIVRKTSGTEFGTLDDADVRFHEAEVGRLTGVLDAARDQSRLPVEAAGRRELHELLLQLRLDGGGHSRGQTS